MFNDKKLVALFVDEVLNHVNLARSALTASLEKNEPVDEIQKILKLLHTVKGSAGILGLEELSGAVHKLETLFQKIRDNGYDDTSRLTAIKSIEHLDKFIKEFPDKYDKNIQILNDIIENKTDAPTVEYEPEKGESYPQNINFNKNSLHVLKDLVEEVRQIVEFNFKGKTARDTKKFRDKIADIIFNIENITLVDLSELTDKTKNIAYYTASKCKKEIDLAVNLQNISLDKNILLQVEDALIHLVRNAVCHGIEKKELRTQANKPPKGKITINSVSYSGRVKISVTDDGGGINFDKIKAKALKMGIVSSERLSSIPDEELLNFIFVSGFSTQDNVDDTSGRGVGLDIVKESIEKIGGFLTIETSPSGTEFAFEIPVSLNIMHCVEISDGKNSAGIPVNVIDKFIILKNECLLSEGGIPRIIYENTEYNYISLKSIFENRSEENDRLAILTRGGRVALGFQTFKGDKILSIKHLKGIIKNIPNIVGLSIGDDFNPVAVINPLKLTNIQNVPYAGEIKIAEKPPSGSVLVADDNNLIRKMISDYLKADGYKVFSAGDGISALGIFNSHKLDLVVTDVEMPRMDGITLLKTIREKDKIIPVLILSSRGEEKDIKNGIESGANGYFVKRYFSKDSLLKKIRELI